MRSRMEVERRGLVGKIEEVEMRRKMEKGEVVGT